MSEAVHRGVSYDLRHLETQNRIVRWKGRHGVNAGIEIEYPVVLIYTNHCYSGRVKADYVRHPEDWIQLCSMTRDHHRLFDVDRHGMSLELVPMIEDLFRKPATLVYHVKRDGRVNYRHFKLTLRNRQLNGQTYNAFFDLRHEPEYTTMRVTSAYLLPRNDRQFASNQKPFFGELFVR